MKEKAFQELYPEQLSYCYGCGTLNKHGLHIKSYWDGDESYCIYTPQPFHMAFPGYVYGGLIASLIDCHSTGTAAAAASKATGLSMEAGASLRFVTGSLKVDYLKPTPLDGPLEVRAKVTSMKGRKVVVSSRLIAKGEICARGEVLAVQMPDHLVDDNIDFAGKT